MSARSVTLSERDVARFIEYIELADQAMDKMDAVVARELDPAGPAAAAYVDAGNTLVALLAHLRDRLTGGLWWDEGAWQRACGAFPIASMQGVRDGR
jgi:hypothetical protein